MQENITNPLDVQVGGNHYKQVKIQPVQFTEHNRLGFCEGNIIKYIVRSRKKDGLQDIQKAGHYLRLLIELEKTNPLNYWLPNTTIDVVTFLNQFPELTSAERDLITIVATWRIGNKLKPDYYENLRRLETISNSFDYVVQVWKNSIEGQNGY